MTGVVLDASAAIGIALDTSRGLRLAPYLPTAAEVMAPDHFFVEVGSALRRIENHGDLSAERAALALRRVLSLRVRRVSTRGLLPVAWDLRRNLTIGNGLYVALARPLNVALCPPTIGCPDSPPSGRGSSRDGDRTAPEFWGAPAAERCEASRQPPAHRWLTGRGHPSSTLA